MYIVSCNREIDIHDGRANDDRPYTSVANESEDVFV